MDKQATLGFILIGIVLVVWMSMNAPSPTQHPTTADSLSVVQTRPEKITPPARSTTPPPADSTGKFFRGLEGGAEKRLVVTTDQYIAELSTRGGMLRKWELRKYLTWQKHPVHLVDYARGGDFSLLLSSADGKLINTRTLNFAGDFPNWKAVTLSGTDSFSVDLVLSIGSGQRIVRRYTFFNGRYSFDSETIFENMQSAVANFEYQIIWETGLPYAEANSVDESRFAKALAFSGGEVSDIDAASEGDMPVRDISGTTDWVAIRNKYFTLAMIPDANQNQGAFLQGKHVPMPDHGVREEYSAAIKMPLRGNQRESGRVTVYLGPLEFDEIKSYSRNLDKILELGPAWIIRPISEYVILPVLEFLRAIIPNFGVVIIVFSILIKIVLHPLTKSTLKSSRQMQALQPLMTEIREKHKDDPQKMNHAIMNLYKDYGINPAAGCLPLLLQMPILFALYAVFSSSIELRQANFFGWIHDLSIPDVVFTLPFTLPLFGIRDVSGLALAMGVTMFLQQKMTITDPRQKAMVWMMPIMMTLLFNSFPSGLNLYYFVFNVLSIVQQMWLNKKHGNEPLRKVDPKKAGGFMGRLTRDLPKLK